MKLIADQLYHVYNQGNNKEDIFKDEYDYLNFLKKIRKHILPVSDILAYCLMPNHYHFLIYSSIKSTETVQLGLLESQVLKNNFRLLNSGYSNEFNNKYGRSGSLFRQKTKYKLLDDAHNDYPFICFNYIHQNPLKAGMVKKMEDWRYSSFQDYMKIRNGTLCNFDLANQLFDINGDDFYESSYSIIHERLSDKLF
ncbi:transposase [Marivirga sp.]|uniref:transposase n=1 Tax=Marivirga sp. TaxID=2018662 RepID=UPI003DA786A4